MKQEEKREKERRGEFEKERDRSESRLRFFSPNQHLLTPHIFCSSLSYWVNSFKQCHVDKGNF